MPFLEIRQDAGRLLVFRPRAASVVELVLIVAGVAVALAVLVGLIGGVPRDGYTLGLLLAPLVAILALLQGLIRRAISGVLGKAMVTLDRERNLILSDRRRLCALTDVDQVEVQGRNTLWGPVEIHGETEYVLLLRLKSGKFVTLDRSGARQNMERVAWAINGYIPLGGVKYKAAPALFTEFHLPWRRRSKK